MSLSDELFEKQIRLIKLIDDIKDEDFTLDAERAALYLGLSPSTLAHRRSDQLPPPYVQIGGAGRGAKVKYRLGDLRQLNRDNLSRGTAESAQRSYGAFLPGVGQLWDDVKEHPFWQKLGQSEYINSVFADTRLSEELFFDDRYKIVFDEWNCGMVNCMTTNRDAATKLYSKSIDEDISTKW
jgi:hypothetical protein